MCVFLVQFTWFHTERRIGFIMSFCPLEANVCRAAGFFCFPKQPHVMGFLKTKPKNAWAYSKSLMKITSTVGPSLHWWLDLAIKKVMTWSVGEKNHMSFAPTWMISTFWLAIHWETTCCQIYKTIRKQLPRTDRKQNHGHGANITPSRGVDHPNL